MTYSYIYKTILATCIFFLFTACERVIDLKLDNTTKAWVIEANLTDSVGYNAVRISLTKNFESPNVFTGEHVAEVSITTQTGIKTILQETQAGIYTHPTLKGVAGETYTLQILNTGQPTIIAKATMPAKVHFDSLFVSDELFFGGKQKALNVNYKDPAQLGNSYRFIPFKRNINYKEIFIENDEYTNSRNVNSLLYFFYDEDEKEKRINTGDTVTVEMQCNPKPMYTYWYSLLRSATGSREQATPANPVSNMPISVLGYFSTHTIQRKTIIVP